MGSFENVRSFVPEDKNVSKKEAKNFSFLNLGGKNESPSGLAENVLVGGLEAATFVLKNLKSNVESERSVAEKVISINAVGSLKGKDKSQYAKLWILAYLDSSGNLKFVEADDKKIVKATVKNGINSQFLIAKDSKNTVVANLYKGRAYVPYSPALDVPVFRERGAEYISMVLDLAEKEIVQRKIESKFYKDAKGKSRLVNEVVSRDLIARLMIIEHVDYAKFLAAGLDKERLQGVFNGVLVLAGTNKKSTYSNSISSKGASGFAQFMPKTYANVVKSYKGASLKDDFSLGVKDHVNAVVAMYCLQDLHLLRAPKVRRDQYMQDDAVKNQYLAAAYNGGAGRANGKIEKFGDDWRENLPRETRVYLAKMDALEALSASKNKSIWVKLAITFRKLLGTEKLTEKKKKEDKVPEKKIKETKSASEKIATPSIKLEQSGNKLVRFPNGLRLAKIGSRAAQQLWRTTVRRPLDILKSHFPGMKLKNIEPNVLKYVKNHYQPELPLVLVSPADLEKNVSKYFKLKEFLRIDIADKKFLEANDLWSKYESYMIRHTDGEYYWKVAKLDPNLCSALDEVREQTGFSIKINEGVRPYEYNRDMYKARGKKPVLESPHVYGKAVDIARTGDPKKDAILLKAMRKVLRQKGGGLGLGNSVYHFDIKIQAGNGVVKAGSTKTHGNWVVSDNGKAKLRTREWGY